MQEPTMKAVEWVRSIREAHYEHIKHLTPEQKIAFFREKASALHAELGRSDEELRTAQPARLPRR